MTPTCFDAKYPVKLISGVRVKMRDGVELNAEIFRGDADKDYGNLRPCIPAPILATASYKQGEAMGLNERRKIKELQDTTFPARVKEIEEICGKPISYEVDWESLADDAEGLNFIDNLSCHRLNMALRVICQDDMGKQAIREGLRLIKLKNVKDKAAMKMSFDAGVLEMNCAYAQRTDGMFSDNAIRELLVAKL